MAALLALCCSLMNEGEKDESSLARFMVAGDGSLADLLSLLWKWSSTEGKRQGLPAPDAFWLLEDVGVASYPRAPSISAGGGGGLPWPGPVAGGGRGGKPPPPSAAPRSAPAPAPDLAWGAGAGGGVDAVSSRSLLPAPRGTAPPLLRVGVGDAAERGGVPPPLPPVAPPRRFFCPLPMLRTKVTELNVYAILVSARGTLSNRTGMGRGGGWVRRVQLMLNCSSGPRVFQS